MVVSTPTWPEVLRSWARAGLGAGRGCPIPERTLEALADVIEHRDKRIAELEAIVAERINLAPRPNPFSEFFHSDSKMPSGYIGLSRRDTVAQAHINRLRSRRRRERMIDAAVRAQVSRLSRDEMLRDHDHASCFWCGSIIQEVRAAFRRLDAGRPA